MINSLLITRYAITECNKCFTWNIYTSFHIMMLGSKGILPQLMIRSTHTTCVMCSGNTNGVVIFLWKMTTPFVFGGSIKVSSDTQTRRSDLLTLSSYYLYINIDMFHVKHSIEYFIYHYRQSINVSDVKIKPILHIRLQISINVSRETFSINDLD